MHVEPPCEQGVASTDGTWAASCGRDKTLEIWSQVRPDGSGILLTMIAETCGTPAANAAHTIIRMLRHSPRGSMYAAAQARNAANSQAIATNRSVSPPTGTPPLARGVVPVDWPSGAIQCPVALVFDDLEPGEGRHRNAKRPAAPRRYRRTTVMIFMKHLARAHQSPLSARAPSDRHTACAARLYDHPANGALANPPSRRAASAVTEREPQMMAAT
jgi:hypothetical protein